MLKTGRLLGCRELYNGGAITLRCDGTLADYPIQHETNPETQKHNQQQCIDVHVVSRCVVCLSSLLNAAWTSLRPSEQGARTHQQSAASRL